MGPLLFALALRLLLDDLEPKLRQWDKDSGGDGLLLRAFYCDDGVFIAKHSILQQVLTYFASPQAKSYGLHIRLDKCQVWWPCKPAAEDRARYPDAVIQSYCSGTKVLQVPVGDLASIETMVTEQVDETQTLLDAIADLEDGHVAFFLLRSCFGSCRLAYTLRCVPTAASLRPARLYDSKIEDTLRRIIGGVLPHDSFAELQLPVKSPRPSFGVGLLSAESAASSAYLASRTATNDLVCMLLGDKVHTSLLDDVHVDGAFIDYTKRCPATDVPSLSDLVTDNPVPQKELVLRVHKQVHATMPKGDERTQLFRAQLSLPGSKDWLKCAPSPGLRTHIADRDFRVWFRFWCRVPMFHPEDKCPRSGCGRNLDVHGDHLLGCTHSIAPRNAPIVWRHDSMTRLMVSDLRSAKRRPALERRDPSTGKSRPDIQCLGESGGKDYIELSIRHPLLGNDMSRKAYTKAPKRVLDQIVADKTKQHSQLFEQDPGANLTIAALTTLGGWNERSRQYIKDAVKSSASRQMDGFDYSILTTFSRYAARLISANVHCLTEGIVTTSETEET